MGKFNVNIKDRHYQELHHALGCPWPNEVMGDTYRNYFVIGDGDTEAAARMNASPHWTNGRETLGSVCFHVSDEGRAALLAYIRANVEIPARYAITYRHHEGVQIVSARSRSAAKYAAYLEADLEWTFMEYAAEIKSVRLHSRASFPQQSR